MHSQAFMSKIILMDTWETSLLSQVSQIVISSSLDGEVGML